VLVVVMVAHDSLSCGVDDEELVEYTGRARGSAIRCAPRRVAAARMRR